MGMWVLALLWDIAKFAFMLLLAPVVFIANFIWGYRETWRHKHYPELVEAEDKEWLEGVKKEILLGRERGLQREG
jgi:hypothetical protein